MASSLSIVVYMVAVTVLFGQVMQTVTQRKQYRCVSLLRPLPQLEPEPKSSWGSRLQIPTTVPKSSTTVTKSPKTVRKWQTAVPKSTTMVPNLLYGVARSAPSSVSTKSQTSDSKSPTDSFSLFRLPFQLISSLLLPLKQIVKQNTTSIISPLINFNMPLTFSKFQPSNPYNPFNPCNSTNQSNPGNQNNSSNLCNTNNPSNPCNPTNPSNPCNQNNPSNLCNSNSPSNPCNPNSIAASCNSNNPSNPCNPTNPSNPCNQNNPSHLCNSNSPSNPCNPTNPSNPCNPTNPSNPCNPTNPSNPCNPTNPSNPCNSNSPSNPCNSNHSPSHLNVPPSGNINPLAVSCNPVPENIKPLPVFPTKLQHGHYDNALDLLCNFLSNKFSYLCSKNKNNIEQISTTEDPTTNDPCKNTTTTTTITTITTSTTSTSTTPPVICITPTKVTPVISTSTKSSTTDNPPTSMPTEDTIPPYRYSTPIPNKFKSCLPPIHIPKPISCKSHAHVHGHCVHGVVEPYSHHAPLQNFHKLSKQSENYKSDDIVVQKSQEQYFLDMLKSLISSFGVSSASSTSR